MAALGPLLGSYRDGTCRVDFYNIGFVLSRASRARVPISVALVFAPLPPPRQKERTLVPALNPVVL